jgi:MFS family permease
MKLESDSTLARRTLFVATLAGVVMLVAVLALKLLARPLGLSGWAASLWLVPVFALSGIRESGLGVAAHSLLLDLAPRSERILYIGLTNSILGVVLLSTGLGGLIVGRFGFVSLLGVALAANLVARPAAARLREAGLTPVLDPALPHAKTDAHPAP